MYAQLNTTINFQFIIAAGIRSHRDYREPGQ